MYTLPRTSKSDPERVIEVDIDNTMYFTIEFSGCKDVVWKSLSRQADECFTFVNESNITNGSGCDERNYTNAAQMLVLICRDYSCETISFQTRMPQSAKAIDMFSDTIPMLSGCCAKMRDIIKAGMADKDLEDMFDEFR